MEIYAMESVLLRTRKMLEAKGETGFELPIAIARVYLSRGIEKIEVSARKILSAVAEGDMLRTQLAVLRRLGKHDPSNTIALGQIIAQKVIEQGKYAVL